ncbi:MAG: hypothetical protein KAG97_02380 [Victivallales bacterium]|nr:hypothetical protein [Victivallales bacterium]
MPRCPGQDQRYWTAEDIFDVRCPSCGNEIEFWKDEPMRFCSSCKKEVRNPRIDLGCAEWCKHAEECLGKAPGAAPASPLIEVLKAKLADIPDVTPEILNKAEHASLIAEKKELARDEIVLTKATTLISSVLSDLNLKLPDDFFDDMSIDETLSTQIREKLY